MVTLGLSLADPVGAAEVVDYPPSSEMGDGTTALAQARVLTLDGNEINPDPAARCLRISTAFLCAWTTANAIRSVRSGEAYCSDSAKGICLWYDAAPGLMHCVYMSANADIDTLAALADELFVPVQGDA
jgi:hypothetical protein